MPGAMWLPLCSPARVPASELCDPDSLPGQPAGQEEEIDALSSSENPSLFGPWVRWLHQGSSEQHCVS